MQIQAQQVSGDGYFTERRLDSQHCVLEKCLLEYSILEGAGGAVSAAGSPYRREAKSHLNKAKGFTVIELVVAMAIAAILSAIALPAFTGFIVQQRLTAQANGFAGAIAYTRSESTRRGSTVSLQALGSDNDNEWGGGYCVVVGNPGDCTDPLRLFDPANQASMDGQGALNGLSTLSFNSRGLFTLGATGQIDLCSDDTLEDPGRRLEISVIGRLNVSELDCPD